MKRGSEIINAELEQAPVVPGPTVKETVTKMIPSSGAADDGERPADDNDALSNVTKPGEAAAPSSLYDDADNKDAINDLLLTTTDDEDPAVVEQAPKALNGTISDDDEHANLLGALPALSASGDDHPAFITPPAEVAGNNLGTNTADASSSGPPPSVTAARKDELLAQARIDRVRWIDRVPLPYRSDNVDTLWTTDPRLATFQASRAGSQLPSALPLLSSLYGMNDPTSARHAAQRVGTILDAVNFTDEDGRNDLLLALPTGPQRQQAALTSERGDDVVVHAYNEFILRLHDPAAASLVQGLRYFCRNIVDITDATMLATKLRSYLQSAAQAVKSHVLFRNADNHPDGPSNNNELAVEHRRSLESFVYGQVDEHVQHVCWNDETQQRDRDWQERVEALQFITPAHLEVPCLDHNADLDLHELLQAPVQALQSVHLYYSGFEKLQRILACYHGVNAALSAALNHPHNNTRQQQVPSADDVLPTIILTVLRARPPRLLADLAWVEQFAPPAYLRGEAGYAYTNLLGAVQFLQELDLHQQSSSSSRATAGNGNIATLNIAADDFRASVANCRQEAANRLQKASSAAMSTDDNGDRSLPLLSDLIQDLPAIPLPDIQQARARGETVDHEWAMQWHAARQKSTDAALAIPIPFNRAPSLLAQDDPTAGLPAAFTRSYTFLSTQPDSVRLADLPQLLTEYRSLVQTVEVLIAERVSKAATERKRKTLAAQQELYQRAQDVDPTLLPEGKDRRGRMMNGKSKHESF